MISLTNDPLLWLQIGEKVSGTTDRVVSSDGNMNRCTEELLVNDRQLAAIINVEHHDAGDHSIITVDEIQSKSGDDDIPIKANKDIKLYINNDASVVDGALRIYDKSTNIFFEAAENIYSGAGGIQFNYAKELVASSPLLIENTTANLEFTSNSNVILTATNASVQLIASNQNISLLADQDITLTATNNDIALIADVEIGFTSTTASITLDISTSLIFKEVGNNFLVITQSTSDINFDFVHTGMEDLIFKVPKSFVIELDQVIAFSNAESFKIKRASGGLIVDLAQDSDAYFSSRYGFEFNINTEGAQGGTFQVVDGIQVVFDINDIGDVHVYHDLQVDNDLTVSGLITGGLSAVSHLANTSDWELIINSTNLYNDRLFVITHESYPSDPEKRLFSVGERGYVEHIATPTPFSGGRPYLKLVSLGTAETVATGTVDAPQVFCLLEGSTWKRYCVWIEGGDIHYATSTFSGSVWSVWVDNGVFYVGNGPAGPLHDIEGLSAASGLIYLGSSEDRVRPSMGYINHQSACMVFSTKELQSGFGPSFRREIWSIWTDDGGVTWNYPQYSSPYNNRVGYIVNSSSFNNDCIKPRIQKSAGNNSHAPMGFTCIFLADPETVTSSPAGYDVPFVTLTANGTDWLSTSSGSSPSNRLNVIFNDAAGYNIARIGYHPACNFIWADRNSSGIDHAAYVIPGQSGGYTNSWSVIYDPDATQWASLERYSFECLPNNDLIQLYIDVPSSDIFYSIKTTGQTGFGYPGYKISGIDNSIIHVIDANVSSMAYLSDPHSAFLPDGTMLIVVKTSSGIKSVKVDLEYIMGYTMQETLDGDNNFPPFP